MKKRSTIENRDTLVITNGPSPIEAFACPWDAVPDKLPELAQFRNIIAIPAVTVVESQQRKLIAKLSDEPDEIRRSISVIWILNEHVISGLAKELYLGSLYRFGALESGVVLSSISQSSINLSEVHWGITDLPRDVTTLARWERSGGGLQIPLAVLSNDGRWLLVPMPLDLNPYLNFPGRLRRVRWTLAAIAAVLFILMVLSGTRYVTKQQSAMNQTTASLIVPTLPPHGPLVQIGERWLNPEARLASRALVSHYEHLGQITGTLKPGRTAFSLWQDAGKPKVTAEPYFDLAIASGDLGSAYLIVHGLSYGDDDRDLWFARITATIWQTALESLHELDFGKARTYTDLYLAMSAVIADGADNATKLGPQRNRTFAWILSRELSTNRIESLCAKPGVSHSFGRLLRSDLGYALPAQDLAGLDARRVANRKLYCSHTGISAVNYDDLAYLEPLSREDEESDDRTVAGEARACQIALLECEFLKLRNKLTQPPSREDSKAILRFSAQCSYLSDDLLYNLLMAPTIWDTNRPGLSPYPQAIRLNIADLRPALKCLASSKSDYRSVIAASLSAASCDTFDGLGTISSTSVGANESLIKGILTRCKSH
jgi:hypothetical protein